MMNTINKIITKEQTEDIKIRIKEVKSNKTQEQIRKENLKRIVVLNKEVF